MFGPSLQLTLTYTYENGRSENEKIGTKRQLKTNIRCKFMQIWYRDWIIIFLNGTTEAPKPNPLKWISSGLGCKIKIKEKHTFTSVFRCLTKAGVVFKLRTEKSCCVCPVSLKLHHVVRHCLGKLLPITGWRGKGHAETSVKMRPRYYSSSQWQNLQA